MFFTIWFTKWLGNEDWLFPPQSKAGRRAQSIPQVTRWRALSDTGFSNNAPTSIHPHYQNNPSGFVTLHLFVVVFLIFILLIFEIFLMPPMLSSNDK